jgi:hypothetical protein
VTSQTERLAFWPFATRPSTRTCARPGLAPASSTYAPDAERYLVTARLAASRTSESFTRGPPPPVKRGTAIGSPPLVEHLQG